MSTQTQQSQLPLIEAWKQRAKKIAEGRKLTAEGDETRIKSNELTAEGSKLYVEGDELTNKGDLIWINAIIETYGKDMTMEWACRIDVRGDNCTLGNGDVYTFEMGKE